MAHIVTWWWWLHCFPYQMSFARGWLSVEMVVHIVGTSTIVVFVVVVVALVAVGGQTKEPQDHD